MNTLTSSIPPPQSFHCYAHLSTPSSVHSPQQYYDIAGIPHLWEGTMLALEAHALRWADRLSSKPAQLTSIAVFPSFSANVEDCMRIERVVGVVLADRNTRYLGVRPVYARIILAPHLRPLIQGGWKIRQRYIDSRLDAMAVQDSLFTYPSPQA